MFVARFLAGGSVPPIFIDLVSNESILKFPDNERGIIDLKWLKLACRSVDMFILGVFLFKIPISVRGNRRHSSDGSFAAYLPIDRANPIKSGTVALHKVIGGNVLLLLSRLDLI